MFPVSKTWLVVNVMGVPEEMEQQSSKKRSIAEDAEQQGKAKRKVNYLSDHFYRLGHQ